MPEAYGGLGASFAYDAAVFEDMESELPDALSGVSVSSGIVAHYILNYGSEEQKKRWLPGMARGELIGAFQRALRQKKKLILRNLTVGTDGGTQLAGQRQQLRGARAGRGDGAVFDVQPERVEPLPVGGAEV